MATGATVLRPLRLLRQAGAITVSEAQQPDGTLVVLKAIDPAAAERDPVGRRRFERELRFAVLLQHPLLPALVDKGENWFALEYLPASLAMAGEARRLSSAAAVRHLIGRLAETLAYVHARGIVHGDLKPGHVLLRGDDPVLIDFGVAMLVGEDPLANVELAGTPAWMAPEQISGFKPAPAADVWSLSAIGLWLLTGTRPFSGDGDEVLERRRRGGAADFDPSSAALRDAPDLAAMLLRGIGSPETRPQAREFVRALSIIR